MCTVSWLLRPDGAGFELFCNRDERRERAPEVPPREDRLGTVDASKGDGTVRALWPRDGAAGGTWVLVNEYGLGLTLLNGYRRADEDDGREWTSRGRLPIELGALTSVTEVEARLAETDFESFRSFVLLALDASGAARVTRWDGKRSSIEDARAPLTSSSFEPERVTARRLAAFESEIAPWANTRSEVRSAAAHDLDLVAEVEAHLAFHAGHDGGPGPHSVCMHREDAETRSFTRVSVTSTEVRLAHTPGSPCRTAPATRLRLPLRIPEPA